MGQSRGELPLFLLINRGRETKRVGGGGGNFWRRRKRQKTGEKGRRKKKNRDSERVGRKRPRERQLFFLREKGEDERKETAGYF